MNVADKYTELMTIVQHSGIEVRIKHADSEKSPEWSETYLKRKADDDYPDVKIVKQWSFMFYLNDEFIIGSTHKIYEDALDGAYLAIKGVLILLIKKGK